MFGRRRYGRRGFRGRGIYRKAGFYGRYNKKGGELKFIDKRIVPIIITAAPSGTAFLAAGDTTINQISQGTGESQRIGRKCLITNFMIRGDVHMDADASTTVGAHDVVRLIVFIDHQANGVNANLQGLLEGPTASTNSFKQLEVGTRFKIIWDKTIALNFNASNGATGLEIVRHVEYYAKLALPINFSASTGAAVEIQNNNIVFAGISRHGNCNFDGIVRIRFRG